MHVDVWCRCRACVDSLHAAEYSLTRLALLLCKPSSEIALHAGRAGQGRAGESNKQHGRERFASNSMQQNRPRVRLAGGMALVVWHACS